MMQLFLACSIRKKAEAFEIADDQSTEGGVPNGRLPDKIDHSVKGGVPNGQQLK